MPLQRESSWRIARDGDGNIVGTKRVWEGELWAERRRPRLYGDAINAEWNGVQWAPWCTACKGAMVWRGTWQCTGCTNRGGWERDGFWAPAVLPREAVADAPIFSTPEDHNSTEGKPSRGKWLDQVELLTSFHRRTTAHRIQRRGTRLSAPPQESPGPSEWANDAEDHHHPQLEHREPVPQPWLGKWHADRVKGQAERFERVRACGSYQNALDITLQSGEKRTIEIETKCGCWRVCRSCAERRRWQLGQGMTKARDRAYRVKRRETARFYRGGEGKWTEKLITFTVPHGESPAEDARVIVDAWQKLLRKVRRNVMERGGVEYSARGKPRPPSIPWCRALEVAPGKTGGHAHLHVWWLGPFLDHVLLRAWWGEILQERKIAVPTKTWGSIKNGRDSRLHEWLGCPADEREIPWPIVDIEKGSEAAAHYTQKVGISLYTMKGSDLHRLSPVHAAKIYEVFEGTRAVQWAMGWAPQKEPMKALCVTFRRLTDEEKTEINNRLIRPRKESGECQKHGTSNATSATNATDGVESSIREGQPSSDVSGAGPPSSWSARGTPPTARPSRLATQLVWATFVLRARSVRK